MKLFKGKSYRLVVNNWCSIISLVQNHLSKSFFSSPIQISGILVHTFRFCIMFCLWFRRLSDTMLLFAFWYVVLISHLIVMFVSFRLTKKKLVWCFEDMVFRTPLFCHICMHFVTFYYEFECCEFVIISFFYFILTTLTFVLFSIELCNFYRFEWILLLLTKRWTKNN